MGESLYADHPDVYDALYAEKEYNEEVAFVVEQFQRQGNGGDRVLVVGCGTGEHSIRLSERGFDVTGVDKYEAMVERARTKSDATFRVGSLPDLPVGGPFDLVLLPFTVVNHLPADALEPSFATLRDVVADGAMLVFDHGNFNELPGHPLFHTYDREEGTYARLFHVHELDDHRYRWDSLVFTPDGRFFADAHELRTYDPQYLLGVLGTCGYLVETYGGYDTDAVDGQSVFVGVA